MSPELEEGLEKAMEAMMADAASSSSSILTARGTVGVIAAKVVGKALLLPRLDLNERTSRTVAYEPLRNPYSLPG